MTRIRFALRAAYAVLVIVVAPLILQPAAAFQGYVGVSTARFAQGCRWSGRAWAQRYRLRRGLGVRPVAV